MGGGQPVLDSKYSAVKAPQGKNLRPAKMRLRSKFMGACLQWCEEHSTLKTINLQKEQQVKLMSFVELLLSIHSYYHESDYARLVTLHASTTSYRDKPYTPPASLKLQEPKGSRFKAFQALNMKLLSASPKTPQP